MEYFEEPHYHACREQRSVCDTSDTSKGICLDRGYCLCVCGARRNAMATCGAEWEPALPELPKALVLRLNARMAIALNMMAACGTEFAMGRGESAALIAQSLQRLGREYPEDCDKIKAAVSALIDTIPRELLEELGVAPVSPAELDTLAKREKREE